MSLIAHVKSVVPSQPLIIIRFEQDDDLALAFCAVTEASPNPVPNLTGLTLWAVRESQGAPFRLREDLVPMVFKPNLQVVKPGTWKLKLEPLKDHLTIMSKQNHFAVIYPFHETGKAGQVQEVVVAAQATPLRMWFTVFGKYRAGATAEPEILESRILCPQAFTQTLKNLFFS
jgi:hypothetical protein